MKKLDEKRLDLILKNMRYFGHKKSVTFTNKYDYNIHTKLERKMTFQMLFIFIGLWLIMFGLFNLVDYINILKGNFQYYFMLLMHVVWILVAIKLNRYLFIKRFNGYEVSESYYKLFND